MGLVAPLALLGLLSAPLIVAFYMLRLRRPAAGQQHLPVAAPRPRRGGQRAVAAAAPLAAAACCSSCSRCCWRARRAALRRAAGGLARDLVLVIDASASMAATDVFPDRLARPSGAPSRPWRRCRPTAGSAWSPPAETARVVANEATDRGRITRAIESIEQSTAAGRPDRRAAPGRQARRARPRRGDPGRDRRLPARPCQRSRSTRRCAC
jgi:hypothetical protein